MAGNWIKMTTDLRTHPKVVRMASALHADRFRIIGGLHAAWCLFDAHSEDGRLVGYTPEVLDDLIGWPGFTLSLMAVGWATFDGDSVCLPRFDSHNGQSAKRRAQEADRKREVRLSASDADKNGTRGEESREEEKQKPSSSASPNDAPADLGQHKAERLAQVTDDAIAAYNAILTAPNGVLPVVTSAGREKRQSEVKRCLRVVKRICQEQYGSTVVTPAFWKAYFDEVARDDFKAGRQVGGKGHEGWKPGFEYLTREATVLEVFERAMSEAV